MKDFYFNSVSQNQYTVVLNNTAGDGYICLNQNCNNNNKKLFISEKIFLSFTISEIKCIHFYSTKNLFFDLKIKNKKANDVMEEINFGHNYINITQ